MSPGRAPVCRLLSPRGASVAPARKARAPGAASPAADPRPRRHRAPSSVPVHRGVAAGLGARGGDGWMDHIAQSICGPQGGEGSTERSGSDRPFGLPSCAHCCVVVVSSTPRVPARGAATTDGRHDGSSPPSDGGSMAGRGSTRGRLDKPTTTKPKRREEDCAAAPAPGRVRRPSRPSRLSGVAVVASGEGSDNGSPGSVRGGRDGAPAARTRALLHCTERGVGRREGGGARGTTPRAHALATRWVHTVSLDGHRVGAIASPTAPAHHRSRCGFRDF